jgi:hypothetical protein
MGHGMRRWIGYYGWMGHYDVGTNSIDCTKRESLIMSDIYNKRIIPDTFLYNQLAIPNLLSSYQNHIPYLYLCLAESLKQTKSHAQ